MVKIGDLDQTITGTIGLLTAIFLNTKISEVENKIQNPSSLVTTTVLNTNISEVENRILNILLLWNLIS